MKKFNNFAAQGDVYIRRLIDFDLNSLHSWNAIEEDLDGRIIVTHSETGHHHVMDGASSKMYTNPKNEFLSVLVIDKPTKLNHLRSFDTHESILFDTGVYEVRRQREYTAEGFRKAQD